MTNNHKIGWSIRSFRESRGYSQDYMAEMLQICQSAYANMESGKTTLSVERLIRICEILDLDIHELITKSLETLPQIHINQRQKTQSAFSETKELYDQLITELKNEIDFLRSLVKEKQV